MNGWFQDDFCSHCASEIWVQRHSLQTRSQTCGVTKDFSVPARCERWLGTCNLDVKPWYLLMVYGGMGPDVERHNHLRELWSKFAFMALGAAVGETFGLMY